MYFIAGICMTGFCGYVWAPVPPTPYHENRGFNAPPVVDTVRRIVIYDKARRSKNFLNP